MSTNANDQQIDPSLLNDVPQYDPDADVNRRILPPDNTIYTAIIRAKAGGKGAVYGVKRSSNGQVFFTSHVEIQLVAPGERWDGFKFEDYINSLVFGETSTIAQIARLAGEPMTRGMSVAQMMEHFERVLAGEPTIHIKGMWQFSYLNPDYDEHSDDKKARQKYLVGLSGMRNFPKDDKGEPIPVTTLQVNGEAVEGRTDFGNFKYVEAPRAARA